MLVSGIFPFFHNVLINFLLQCHSKLAKLHTSVHGALDLLGGHWFNSWLGQYSYRGLLIVIATGFIPGCCLDNDYMRKQPMAWKENCVAYWFNSLQNDKILAGADFKGFADDKIQVNQKLEFNLGKVYNTVGKGENAV